ncbi:glycosyltransferase [Sphingobacterium sp.]|uniref:glycosyltransferase n=1 Tax=Sphingobacterium sp. TaxID=341027 RepID=UPI0028A07E43|nr:glycosyltransferase [Sphingobacterium sp.]
MKIKYLIDFSIEGNSGKNKATKEKANALMNIIGESNFTLISNNKAQSFLGKISNKIFFDLKVFFKLLFVKGDYVIVQRVLFMPFTRFLFMCKNILVVTEFHADFKEEIPLLNKSAIEKRFLKFASFFYNFNYKISDAIIYNHPYLKDKFDPIFRKPSIYSFNGSNTNCFFPMEISTARERLGIPNNEIICLFLGSVSQWHGVDYLISLFQKSYYRDGKDVKLYVVGAKTNDYTKTLMESANKSNVTFVPPVNNEDAMLYINSADLCMLPVKSNRTSPGSPLKLYDYISCGKPVLTQKMIAGYADEVENYGLGWTIDFTDYKKASEEFEKILKSSSFDFVKNNRFVAEEKLNWRMRMTKWIEFIEGINKC